MAASSRQYEPTEPAAGITVAVVTSAPRVGNPIAGAGTRTPLSSAHGRAGVVAIAVGAVSTIGRARPAAAAATTRVLTPRAADRSGVQ
jgi:hypothetical protein